MTTAASRALDGSELQPQLELPDSERAAFEKVALALTANPYSEYEDFCALVHEQLYEAGHLPTLRDAAARWRQEEPVDEPLLFVRNAPTDPVLPVLNWNDPVQQKYELKQTWVAEAFLAWFALAARMPSLAYINVNNGDRFQDILPKESLAQSQSQKALGPIYFHKDLANHFVRPDFVNMLGLRSDPRNKVYTSFSANQDVLDLLSAVDLAVLRTPIFHTPFDDLTVMSGSLQVGEASRHAILEGERELRLFENRTVAVDEEGRGALERVVAAVHQVKRRLLMQRGDFVSLHNNLALHAKEIVHVEDEDALRLRWSIKTVNVFDLEAHADKYLAGRYGIVAG